MTSAFKGILHWWEYVWDFADDGGAQGEIVLSAKSGFAALPLGAIVLDVIAYVKTAVISGGSLTLDVGDSDDPNGYMEALAVANLTANSVHRAGSVAGAKIWDDTNDHYLGRYVADAGDSAFSVTIGAADATAGKVVFGVQFWLPGNQL